MYKFNRVKNSIWGVCLRKRIKGHVKYLGNIFLIYRVFLNQFHKIKTKRANLKKIQGVHEILCFFPENVVIFLNYASSAAALVFYLPGVCTQPDTEGKERKARV